MAQALNLTQPLTVGVALQYVDSVYARYLLGLGLAPGLIGSLMQMRHDFINQTSAQDPTSNRAFVTGLLTEMLALFQSTVDLDDQGTIQKA